MHYFFKPETSKGEFKHYSFKKVVGGTTTQRYQKQTYIYYGSPEVPGVSKKQTEAPKDL